ncbi:hypothetical protein [Marinobacter sp. F4206]|uniref:hypothetical protein n=1 Tax=Marinobacter sp. F4206 TaxID=2861777 RepID=UPI001C5EBBBA|nr:hypothetical protein [Marinobacter sp. F4206]MBW4933217.1 hypothetical protein [Marinobacter sp. F4206]
MLRAAMTVGLILALVATAVFVPRMLSNNGQEEWGGPNVPCDLLAESCSWSSRSGLWTVDLEVLDTDGQDTEYRLTVVSPEPPERFLAVLRGESMYMGEYPVPLRRQVDGTYVARFNAPICSTGEEMVWRVDLQQGQERLKGIPVKLVFQARHL